MDCIEENLRVNELYAIDMKKSRDCDVIFKNPLYYGKIMKDCDPSER